MSLQFSTPVNGSTPDKEIIWLRATAAVNLRGYAIADQTFVSGGDVSNEFRHVYFFPNTQVAAGEWVELNTGTGTNKKRTDPQGNVIHTFYWGSNACVWNNAGDVATLIQYTAASTVQVPAVNQV